MNELTSLLSASELEQATTAEKQELLKLLESKYREPARNNLAEFYSAVPIPGAPIDEDADELGASPNATAYYPELLKPAEHHKLCIAALNDVIQGNIKRLMIFMPPGSAKSTLASVLFPTWYLGHYPRRQLISCSYNLELAASFGNRCRQLIRSDEYKQTFDLELTKDSAAADRWALTNGSTYSAFGLLSGVTGRRAHGVIIDDPIKGREAADSETQRNKVFETYLSDVTSRLFPGGFQIIIQTRWHEEDLSGKILGKHWNGGTGWTKDAKGLDWFVLSLEAECTRDDDPLGRDPGEFLWLDWFDQQHWSDTKTLQSARNWSALYQQRPAPDTGLFFTSEMITYYDWDGSKPHRGAPDHLDFYAASDYATKDGEGDYTVHGIVGYDQHGDLWIVDWWRGQTTTNVWIEMALNMAREWKPVVWGEEKGQIRNSVEPFLKKRMQETNTYFPRYGVAATSSKAARSQTIRGLMEQGKVHFPSGSPWSKDLVAELLRFDGNDTNTDDQVDVMSLLGLMVTEYRSSDRPPAAAERDFRDQPVSSLIEQHLERRKRAREDGEY